MYTSVPLVLTIPIHILIFVFLFFFKNHKISIIKQPMWLRLQDHYLTIDNVMVHIHIFNQNSIRMMQFKYSYLSFVPFARDLLRIGATLLKEMVSALSGIPDPENSWGTKCPGLFLLGKISSDRHFYPRISCHGYFFLRGCCPGHLHLLLHRLKVYAYM